jgi:hypothetical protein
MPMTFGAKSNSSFQPLMGVVPVLLSVMLPVKPLPQSLLSTKVAGAGAEGKSRLSSHSRRNTG